LPSSASSLKKKREYFRPEQIWDVQDLPNRKLINGRPSGSAMPLVWAHAEYIKLMRSLHDGHVFDTPPQPTQRYQKERIVSPLAFWRFNHKCRTIPPGKMLRLEVLAPALVRWSTDDWQSALNIKTQDTGLGVHIVDLPTNKLSRGTALKFTFYWPESSRWEGSDFVVEVESW
jgi:glucoamylase